MDDEKELQEKLKNLQKHIPFLQCLLNKLKGTQHVQLLNKIETLYGLISSENKLSSEILKKCEKSLNILSGEVFEKKSLATKTEICEQRAQYICPSSSKNPENVEKWKNKTISEVSHNENRPERSVTEKNCDKEQLSNTCDIFQGNQKCSIETVTGKAVVDIKLQRISETKSPQSKAGRLKNKDNSDNKNNDRNRSYFAEESDNKESEVQSYSTQNTSDSIDMSTNSFKNILDIEETTNLFKKNSTLKDHITQNNSGGNKPENDFNLKRKLKNGNENSTESDRNKKPKNVNKAFNDVSENVQNITKNVSNLLVSQPPKQCYEKESRSPCSAKSQNGHIIADQVNLCDSSRRPEIVSDQNENNLDVKSTKLKDVKKFSDSKFQDKRDTKKCANIDFKKCVSIEDSKINSIPRMTRSMNIIQTKNNKWANSRKYEEKTKKTIGNIALRSSTRNKKELNIVFNLKSFNIKHDIIPKSFLPVVRLKRLQIASFKDSSTMLNLSKKGKTKNQRSKTGKDIEHSNYNTNEKTVKNINPDIHIRDIENYASKCVICPFNGRHLSHHYISTHPLSEVLISRLPSDIIEKLKKNIDNIPKRERKGIYCYELACQFCDVKFSFTPLRWVHHYSTHTGEYLFKCTTCNRFATRNPVTNDNHVQRCEKPKIIRLRNVVAHGEDISAYVCDLCNYIQLNESGLRKHLRKEHEINNEFYSKIILIHFKHFETQTNELCKTDKNTNKEKNFTQVNNLSREKNVVKNTNPEIHPFNRNYNSMCILCNFNAGRHLVAHYVRNHSKSEVFISRLPLHVVNYLKNDTNNIAVKEAKLKCYLNIYKFKCPFCNIAKRQSRCLWLRHLCYHTGERKYTCSNCKGSANTKGELKTYTECTHDQINYNKHYPKETKNVLFAHICILCNYIQFCRNNIKRHLQEQHLLKENFTKDCILKVKIIKFRNNKGITYNVNYTSGFNSEMNERNKPSDSLLELTKSIPTTIDKNNEANSRINSNSTSEISSLTYPRSSNNTIAIKNLQNSYNKKTSAAYKITTPHNESIHTTNVGNMKVTEQSESLKTQRIKNIGFKEEDPFTITFHCLLDNCTFSSEQTESVCKHFENKHSSIKWNGFCCACARYILSKRSSLATELEHMQKYHTNDLIKNKPNVSHQEHNIIELKDDDNKKNTTSNNSNENEILKSLLKIRRLPGDKLSGANEVVSSQKSASAIVNVTPIAVNVLSKKDTDKMNIIEPTRTSLVNSSPVPSLKSFVEGSTKLKTIDLKNTIESVALKEIKKKIPPTMAVSKKLSEDIEPNKQPVIPLISVTLETLNVVDKNKNIEPNVASLVASRPFTLVPVAANTGTTSAAISDIIPAVITSPTKLSEKPVSHLVEKNNETNIKRIESNAFSSSLFSSIKPFVEYKSILKTTNPENTIASVASTMETASIETKKITPPAMTVPRMPLQQSYIKGKSEEFLTNGVFDYDQNAQMSSKIASSVLTMKPILNNLTERFLQVKPWTKTLSIKNEIVVNRILRDLCLFSLYKCMGDNCIFTTNSKEKMLEHLKYHELTSQQTAPETLRAYFECPYCDRNVGDRNALVCHIETDHIRDVYQCPYCFYRSCSEQNVLTHLNAYHWKAERLIFVCFGNPKYLEHETNNITASLKMNVRGMNCYKCKTPFMIVKNYIEHMLQEHSNSDGCIPCGMCSRTKFNSEPLMINHLVITHETAFYECIYCSFVTNSLEHMPLHLADDHNSQLPYMCARKPRCENQPIFEEETVTSSTMLTCIVEPVDTNIYHHCPYTEKQLNFMIPFFGDIDPNISVPFESPSVQESTFQQMPQIQAMLPNQQIFIPLHSQLYQSNFLLPATAPTAVSALPSVSSGLVQNNFVPLSIQPTIPMLATQTTMPTVIMLHEVTSVENNVLGSDAQVASKKSSFQMSFYIEPEIKNVPNALEYNETKNIEKLLKAIVIGTGFEGEELYRCGIENCNVSSLNAVEFHFHIMQHSSIQSSYKCYHCKAELSTIAFLRRHLEHHAPNRYFCYICEETGASEEIVRYHCINVHKLQNIVTNPVLSNRLNHKKDFFIVSNHHMKCNLEDIRNMWVRKMSKTNRLFSPDDISVFTRIADNLTYNYHIYCSVCKYGTKNQSDLIYHLLCHKAGIDKHTLNKTNVQKTIETLAPVPTKLSIPKHIRRSHHFICGIPNCLYKTVYAAMFKDHLATHNSQTMYNCPYCNEIICQNKIESVAIIEHLKLHAEKLWQCGKCNHIETDFIDRIMSHIVLMHPNTLVSLTTYIRTDAKTFEMCQKTCNDGIKLKIMKLGLSAEDKVLCVAREENKNIEASNLIKKY